MSEKSWKKAKKSLKRSVVLKRSNWTNILNWKQVSNMNRHKKSILKRESIWEVKMGRSSPICEKQKLHLKIVENFESNVPQCKVGKILNISPSTVHNIIQRFREYGDQATLH